ncbi:MAG TPA: tetratricopeptide repeat protein [Gemmatimonadaceae bacterium]|jgi:tetratricopeptide (TPR) repeat protein|nr:tetratricopeptide repeat protein [Gemmatimonadaceae bacterium]
MERLDHFSEESSPRTRRKVRGDDLEAARELVGQARAAEQTEQTAKAIGLYDDALACFHPDTFHSFYADILRWKGTLLRERGETEAAYRCYSLSLAKASRSHSDAGQAHALNCLAIIAQRRGDQKETDRLYRRAAALAEKAGESRLLGMIQQNRGVLANMRGDFAAAAEAYTASLSAFEQAADLEAVSWVLNNMGMLDTRIRNFGDALLHLERGLELARKRNDAIVESIITLNLAEARIGLGQLDMADDLCTRALDAAQRRGDHLTAAGALKCKASIERERGALDKSIATLRIAIYEAEGAEDRLLHAEMLRELGEISRSLGNAGAARSAWREAAESFRQVGAKHDLADLQSRMKALPT